MYNIKAHKILNVGQASRMKKKSQKILYKDVVDSAETEKNIDIFKMIENKDKNEIDFDANVIQYIAEQF